MEYIDYSARSLPTIHYGVLMKIKMKKQRIIQILLIILYVIALLYIILLKREYKDKSLMALISSYCFMCMIRPKYLNIKNGLEVRYNSTLKTIEVREYDYKNDIGTTVSQCLEFVFVIIVSIISFIVAVSL